MTAELEIKYAGYFARERDQAEKLRRLGNFFLDADLPYESMLSLAFEAVLHLAPDSSRPEPLCHIQGTMNSQPVNCKNMVAGFDSNSRGGRIRSHCEGLNPG